MIIEVEHFGTKGMHWGITTTIDAKAVNKPKRPKQQMRLEKKKKFRNVSIGVGLIGGGAVVAALIARHNKLKIKDINQTRQSAQKAKDLIDANRNVKVKLSSEHRKFLSEFGAKQSLINKGANEDLKKLYTLAETPIRDRGYLPSWQVPV
jgi:hypothetical protein